MTSGICWTYNTSVSAGVCSTLGLIRPKRAAAGVEGGVVEGGGPGRRVGLQHRAAVEEEGAVERLEVVDGAMPVAQGWEGGRSLRLLCVPCRGYSSRMVPMPRGGGTLDCSIRETPTSMQGIQCGLPSLEAVETKLQQTHGSNLEFFAWESNISSTTKCRFASLRHRSHARSHPIGPFSRSFNVCCAFCPPPNPIHPMHASFNHPEGEVPCVMGCFEYWY